MLVRCGKNGNLVHCWWECMHTANYENYYGGASNEKLKIELLYDPVIPLQGICLKECKSAYNRDTCTLMLIAAPFTITKLWNQPRCPTTDKYIKKMWYTYTVEYYTTIKNNEIMSSSETWMELKIMMRLDSERQIPHVFSHMQNLGLKKRKEHKTGTTEEGTSRRKKGERKTAE
jgi:hypothetical protein